MIRKVAIRNYRVFRSFDLDLRSGSNIIVGRNDTGKSTLIEAITLALTCRLRGRPLGQELSPYLINLGATHDYLKTLREGGKAAPPEIIIEAYLEESEDSEPLRGTNNLFSENACGVRIHARLSQEFCTEYLCFIDDPHSVRLPPTEYYRVDWLAFSGNPVSARSIPGTASLIDPAAIRLQSGVDYHLQEILRTYLEPKERVELSRQYRSLRQQFSDKESVKAVNDRLKADAVLLDHRTLSLGIDISQRYTWESSLAAHLDDLPFQLIGMGDQNVLKTLLAIGRKAESAQVVLIEEPETHLCYSSLRKLLRKIEERCVSKQVIIATHSTYVLNKLGLDNLVLLGDGAATRITDVPVETVDYFKALAVFDTLRLVLSEGAILVEGPSDELIVQRAYLDARGRLPIEDGIDVISVGLSHKRFLDLAVRLNRRVWVVTDNDGHTLREIEERFADYLGSERVSLHVGSDPALTTLEPQIVAVNDLETLNAALGKKCCSKEAVLQSMLNDKTGSALAIFEATTSIVMPKYITDVIPQ